MKKIIPMLKYIWLRIQRLFYTKKEFRRITGKKNKIINNSNYSIIRYNIIGDNNQVEFEKDTNIANLHVYIRGNNNIIKVGSNCYFGDVELWVENNNCEIRIEDLTTIESAHLAVGENGSKIILHRDCMLSKEIEIRTTDAHSILDLSSGKRINPAMDVILKSHVWVGARAMILKGVTVGEHSIVGAGSIVTKDVPEHVIVSGVSAKVVKENITWVRERIEMN